MIKIHKPIPRPLRLSHIDDSRQEGIRSELDASVVGGVGPGGGQEGEDEGAAGRGGGQAEAVSVVAFGCDGVVEGLEAEGPGYVWDGGEGGGAGGPEGVESLEGGEVVGEGGGEGELSVVVVSGGYFLGRWGWGEGSGEGRKER